MPCPAMHGAMPQKNLGFDGTDAKLIADGTLEAHVIEVVAEGTPPQAASIGQRRQKAEGMQSAAGSRQQAAGSRQAGKQASSKRQAGRQASKQAGSTRLVRTTAAQQHVVLLRQDDRHTKSLAERGADAHAQAPMASRCLRLATTRLARTQSRAAPPSTPSAAALCWRTIRGPFSQSPPRPRARA